MNTQEIENLYRRLYKKKIKLLTFILKGDVATAEDVFQETFARAFKYKHIYNEKKGTEETWINSIMFKVLWSIQQESKHITPPKVEELTANDLLEMDQLQTSPEFRQHLLKEINSVRNDKHKKVLLLFFMFGYSSIEIAEMGLGVSQTNVTTIVNRFKESIL